MRTDVDVPAEDPAPHPGGGAAGGRAVARRSRVRWAAAGAVVTAVLGASCVRQDGNVVDAPVKGPGPGVVFAYPADRQHDVPTRARVLLTFSERVPTPVDTACARSGGEVTGALCLEGPDGFVQGSVTVDGATVVLTPPAGGLAPGVQYQVWARPALLPGATNLPAAAPLLTFRTRSTRILPGTPATVLTVNGEPLAADGSTATPLLDAAPVRLLFSEPLDPATVTTASVRLVHVADAAAVDGFAVAHSVHVTFQPSQPLTAGETYRLELTDAVHDAGGERLAPVAFLFTPRRMATPGHDLYKLSLNVAPAWGPTTDVAAAGATSRLAAIPVNSNVLTSQLIGTNTLGVLAGGLDTLMGDPDAAGSTGHAVNPLPSLIRRGQRLDLSSLPIRLGGQIDTRVRTGTTHFTMLTDAVGRLMRNPFRPEAQEPDDVQSPTFVDFTMDAVLTSDDGTGHVVSTQTVMGIRVLGLSVLDGDELAIDQAGAIDYDLQGLDTAPVALAMRLRTAPERATTPALVPPFLISSFPASGAVDVSPAAPLELNLSGAVDPRSLPGAVALAPARGGAPIPASVRLEGATLVVVPARRLDEGTAYTLGYAGLRGVSGVEVPPESVTFTTAVTTAPKATPPILVALTPGAPCALAGASATSGGRCADGKDTDAPYQPFTLPANRDVRALFSQPIDPATLTLGAACGQGSVRIERLDGSGQCAAPVPGSLVKLDRELRFLPSAPWTLDAVYRITLVAGPNAACDGGEICGRNALPLDTDPLVLADAPVPGGPDVVVSFKGAAATADTYQPQASDPRADQNGNGALDASERPNDENRVAMELVGFGGIVTAASLDGEDCVTTIDGKQACSYLDGTLPASIGGVLSSCPVDGRGQPSTAPNPCVEVRVFPSLILGTSISMSSTALGLIPMSKLPTGLHVMRLRETDGPIHGYIMTEVNKDGVAEPQFVINQDLYLDQPQLKIPLATHDVRSKPIRSTMKGPVTFGPDGRMRVALKSLNDVSIRVNIDAGFLIGKGYLDLRIPAGQMHTTLVGPPPR